MHFRLGPALRVLCISLFLLFLVQTKAATPAAFVGTYHLSNIVEDSSGVHFTMTVNVLNPRTSDIQGGIVALLDSSPHPLLLGSFNAITVLPHASQKTVVNTFTVSAAEYARWQKGHPPALQFIVPTISGAVAADMQAHEVLKPGESTN